MYFNKLFLESGLIKVQDIHILDNQTSTVTVNKIESTECEKISTYAPPKSCIPKRANIKMNRNKRNNRLRMERMLLRRDITRLRREAQYLKKKV